MRNHIFSAFSSLALGSVALIGVSGLAGCRNATNGAVSSMGQASPLTPVSPMQPGAMLSPAPGVSATGAPTRVPPPPTGSYQSSTNYGASIPGGASLGPGGASLGPGGASLGYAPTGAMPSGAALGSSGMTRGVTELNASPPISNGVAANAGGSPDSSVRQTGWVSEGSATPNTTTFGAGYDNTTPPGGSTAPSNAPGVSSPAYGGMPVIDLTTAPNPPGYYPQQASNFTPTSASVPSGPTIGQSNTSTFQRSDATDFDSATSVASRPGFEGASRFGSASLPSTEPFPTNSSDPSSGDGLQWRRPSPRF
ncbi:hypothetical protein FYK55_05665 [Roseiconus nitratireducens]|uniref:Uncharacterized protein n=1 Tax=Roseiconus nitratireducens TaxID=2605748 RepID=A0A5M6DC74_9BACT|nr:hypothetical protein [Roseiconus nitratireducens]KAA5545161.1 hypothetical protein FYK55_05665 [Roseiconus nitratireducens]